MYARMGVGSLNTYQIHSKKKKKKEAVQKATSGDGGLIQSILEVSCTLPYLIFK